MGDRRSGDRRSPEKGVVKIAFKDAFIYISFTIIVLILLVCVIVCARNVNYWKEQYVELYDSYENLETYNEELQSMNDELLDLMAESDDETVGVE